MSDKKEEVKWKSYTRQEYDAEIKTLVHFSAKAINTKASAGVRITRDKKLNLPYLSVRTLLDDGVDLLLDYHKDGTRVGRVSQINAIVTGAPRSQMEASANRQHIKDEIEKIRATEDSFDVESVDHRLRQILIQKKDIDGGYVALTPLAAHGLCFLLSGSYRGDTSGLIGRHNAEAKEDKDKKNIQQAFFKVGGTKSQNVGSLANAVQHPLMLGAPRPPAELKKAFALYHSGLRFSVYRRSAFQSAVRKYVEYREKVLLNPKPGHTITLREREREARLLAAIAASVLAAGAEAQHTLRRFASELPHEAQLPDTDPPEFALVSPHLPFEMRALLDSRLRNKEWPRKMAVQTVSWMLAPQGREQKRLLLLDGSARASIENMLEGHFR